jgi:putative transposase
VKICTKAGYGALSIGERSLEIVMEYAARQKEHHREKNVLSQYERIDEDD